MCDKCAKAARAIEELFGEPIVEEVLERNSKYLPDLVRVCTEQFMSKDNSKSYNAMLIILGNACMNKDGKDFDRLMEVMRLHKEGLNAAARIFMQSQWAVLLAANTNAARMLLDREKPKHSPSHN